MDRKSLLSLKIALIVLCAIASALFDHFVRGEGWHQGLIASECLFGMMLFHVVRGEVAPLVAQRMNIVVGIVLIEEAFRQGLLGGGGWFPLFVFVGGLSYIGLAPKKQKGRPSTFP